MGHVLVSDNLGELARGIPFRERAAALAHLAACPECREMADTYSTIATAMHGGTVYSLDVHPLTPILVDLAIRREALDEAKRESVEAHVRDCGPCQMDLLAIRQAELRVQESTFREGPWKTLPRWVPAAAAAAVVLALLAYPAYLGVIDLLEREAAIPTTPEHVRGTIAASQRRGGEGRGTWGPVELLVLRSPLRGAEEIPRVSVLPGQPLIPLAVVLDYEGIKRDVTLRLSSERAESTVWEHVLPVDQLSATIRSAGFVTFLVPVDLLETGTYRLTVVAADASSMVLFEAPFEVQRQAPAATNAPQ